MIIKKVDGLGVDLGNRWIRHDNPEFPKGNLYTEDEIEKAVKRRLERQNFVRLEDYKELQDKLDSITKFVNLQNKI